jgi:ABC-type oligopeptide transport system substrate-binding subunit
MWRDILGVEVELDKREWKYFLETRDRRDEWQIMRFAWLGDFNDASTFADILLSSSPQNLPGYSSERYDDLLAAALDEPDPAERSKLMTAAEATMLNDYPIVPLYFYVSKHLVNPDVQGFDNNVLDQHLSRYLRK